MIFDSTVFTLTIYRSVALWKQGGRGLVHVVMRDGEFSHLNDLIKFRRIPGSRCGILCVSRTRLPSEQLLLNVERSPSVLGFSTLSNALTFLVSPALCPCSPSLTFPPSSDRSVK